jgi:hypothetical protein
MKTDPKKEEFCRFIGSKAFEDDGGWSYAVWCAAHEAALQQAIEKFKRHGSIPFDADEVVEELQKLR